MLAQRTQSNGIDALLLTPTMSDFNDDLRQLGAEALIAAIRVQLAPEDVACFWISPEQHRRERLSLATCIVCRDVTKPRQPRWGDRAHGPSERAIGPEAVRAGNG